MTLTQLEERLTALEKVVKELQTQRMAPSVERMNSNAPALPENDDELIPGVEYPFVVTAPPKEEWHIVGKIVAIETPPAELGLSEAEWASLDLEEDEDE
jgi:hypothetical protein